MLRRSAGGEPEQVDRPFDASPGRYVTTDDAADHLGDVRPAGEAGPPARGPVPEDDQGVAPHAEPLFDELLGQRRR